jgi:Ala-tRNA(Pro) deacylase
MIAELRELLTRERVRFEVIRHREALTTQEQAGSGHVPGCRLAKVVIVRDGQGYAMVVLSATAELDLSELRRRTRRYDLAVASEDDFQRLSTGCEIDAMPPFGGIFGLPVFLDRAFAMRGEMVFASRTHREEVSMSMGEYVRVERPAIAPLACAPLAA